jgi:hypothetical protein
MAGEVGRGVPQKYGAANNRLYTGLMVFRAGHTAASRFPAAHETARVMIMLYPGCLRRVFARVSGDACLIAGP